MGSSPVISLQDKHLSPYAGLEGNKGIQRNRRWLLRLWRNAFAEKPIGKDFDDWTSLSSILGGRCGGFNDPRQHFPYGPHGHETGQVDLESIRRLRPEQKKGRLSSPAEKESEAGIL